MQQVNETGRLTVKELIDDLRMMCPDENAEVEFHSWEWNDDLEDLSYHERYYEGIKISETGVLKIMVSR